MEYKFNKQYLNNLIKDARLRYEAGIVTKRDYELLKSTIHNLTYGEREKTSNIRINNIDVIKINLNILIEKIGIDNIENILNVAEEFLKNSSKQKAPYDIYKQTSDDLVIKVLEFYEECSGEDAKYLNEFIYSPYSQLEIITRNIFNKGKYRNVMQMLPIYDMEFIRIVKSDILYDEAKLCHELRHELDIKKLTINSMDLNALAEVNPIATELFYQIRKIDKNPKYLSGIIKRMNSLRSIAHQLVPYMNLIIQMSNFNTLNIRMIEETFKIKEKEDLHDILADLDTGQIYQLISYFIGTLKGIYLCDIAMDDLKSALELQDKLCSILVTDKFIPENIADTLGSEFVIGENDIKTYKKLKNKYL